MRKILASIFLLIALVSPNTALANETIYYYTAYPTAPLPADVDFAREILSLVNEERAKVGAKPLVLDKELMDGCKIRAQELTELYSHTRPNGRDCFSVLRRHNAYKGENIAAGQSSPAEVMESWMNSPGHRANILNKKYKKLGVGYYYKEGTTYSHHWVQLFLGKDM